MVALQDVVDKVRVLKQEWAKTPCNLPKCGQFLDELKIALTTLRFLPTKDVASEQELLIAREVLEIGAQWSIASEDIPSFERYMAQLKSYYFDYKSNLPESPYKYQLLGLNLLFLLSQNRVAEFHTELELLPVDCIQTNIYIRHPLSLEQNLMEGSYNKIFLAKGNVPAASYNFFIDILLNTVRDEIGACMENAFDKISAKDAARMLNLSTEQEMLQFCSKKKWKIASDTYLYFGQPAEKKIEEPIPSAEYVTLAIDYARELEMIV